LKINIFDTLIGLDWILAIVLVFSFLSKDRQDEPKMSLSRQSLIMGQERAGAQAVYFYIASCCEAHIKTI